MRTPGQTSCYANYLFPRCKGLTVGALLKVGQLLGRQFTGFVTHAELLEMSASGEDERIAGYW
jgi:hypothetical protein